MRCGLLLPQSFHTYAAGVKAASGFYDCLNENALSGRCLVILWSLRQMSILQS